MKVEYNNLDLDYEDTTVVKYKRKYSLNEVLRLLFILSLPFVITAFLISIDDILPAKKTNKIALGGS